jgi:hypothetical protein
MTARARERESITVRHGRDERTGTREIRIGLLHRRQLKGENMCP